MWILKAFGDQNVSVQVGIRYVRFAADGLCAYVRRLETCDTLTPEVAIPRSERESYVVDRKEFLQRLTYLKECASPAKTTPVVYFENGCLSLMPATLPSGSRAMTSAAARRWVSHISRGSCSTHPAWG